MAISDSLPTMSHGWLRKTNASVTAPGNRFASSSTSGLDHGSGLTTGLGAGLAAGAAGLATGATGLGGVPAAGGAAPPAGRAGVAGLDGVGGVTSAGSVGDAGGFAAAGGEVGGVAGDSPSAGAPGLLAVSLAPAASGGPLGSSLISLLTTAVDDARGGAISSRWKCSRFYKLQSLTHRSKRCQQHAPSGRGSVCDVAAGLARHLWRHKAATTSSSKRCQQHAPSSRGSVCDVAAGLARHLWRHKAAATSNSKRCQQHAPSGRGSLCEVAA